MLAVLTTSAALAWQAGPAAPVRRVATAARPAAMSLTEQQERVARSMELSSVASLEAVESPRSVGLALKLDDGTRKSHSMAENTAFVTGFFRGIATTDSFSQLVASLYFVYDAMEAAFDTCTDPSVKALDYPALRRVSALEADMEYYFGPNWPESVQPSAATRRYVARVEEVARDAPYLLVAHMYTRYLGDLFGGQMMGGMARRSLELQDGKGTAFYEFEEIPQTKPFIEDWYRELNKVELSEAQKQAIVDEGNLVFALNIEVFEELEGNPVQALWTLATASLRSALGLKD